MSLDTSPHSSEKKEACGLFAIHNHPHASSLISIGLFALQHRGEEGAGIVVTDEEEVNVFRDIGYVSNIFTQEKIDKLKGTQGIGHTRYSVTGVNKKFNTQPLVSKTRHGTIAIAHNGNLVNAKKIKQKLQDKGAIFQTTVDSEIFLHLLAQSQKLLKEAIIETVKQVEGSFCLLVLSTDNIYAIRDPHGFRPLCLGLIKNEKKEEELFENNSKDTWVIASESSALDIVGAKYLSEVKAGEMLTIGKGGVEREYVFGKQAPAKEKKCIFELIYFSRPDAFIFSESVYEYRKNLGKILAHESPVDADMVIPIPDSGMYSALGYSQEMNIPMEIGITRNHYVGRSFIQPLQSMREHFVKLKLNPIAHLIKGKRVVLIDDSVVRGTTTKQKIKAVWNCGAKEVHLRIASPPIKHPCYYGIDFAEKKELIANKMAVKEIESYFGINSFAYLSLEGTLAASQNVDKDSFCNACFSGNYPIERKESYAKKDF